MLVGTEEQTPAQTQDPSQATQYSTVPPDWSQKISTARGLGFGDSEIADYLKNLGVKQVDDARNYVDPTTNKPAPFTDTEILNYLSGKTTPTATPGLSVDVANPKGLVTSPKAPPTKLSDIAREGITGLVGAGTGVATESPFAASGAMAAADYLMRKGQGEPENVPIYGDLQPAETTAGKIGNAVEDIGSNALANEGVGRILDMIPETTLAALKAIKELRNPGSVVDPELAALKPTYSQFAEAEGKPTLKVVEDIFARASKEKALDTSASLAFDKANDIGNQLMQQTAPANRLNVGPIADRLQNQLRQDYVTALTKSGKTADAVNSIAELNPTSPISLDETAQKLIDFKSQIAKSLIKPDDTDPLVKNVDTMLKSLGYTTGTDGSVTFTNKSVPFNTAWQTKKQLGALAFENDDGTPDYVKKAYKDIYSSLDNDITNGISQWKVGASDALKNWNNTKEIVNKTYSNFYPQGIPEIGKMKLTDASVNPQLDAITEDPKKLQAFLNTGEMKLTDGTVITSSNKRSDLQGYKFESLFRDAWKPLDASEVSNGQTNGKKLVATVSDYLDSDAGRKLYSTEQRKNISDFVNNVNTISTPLGPPSRYFTLRAGTSTAAITGGLLSHILGGSAISGGAIGSGAVLFAAIGLHQVGKLLTNPEAARILIAAQSGAPLGVPVRLASRILGTAMRGQPMQIELQGGQKVTGKVDSSGQFQPETTIPAPTTGNPFTSIGKGPNQ